MRAGRIFCPPLNTVIFTAQVLNDRLTGPVATHNTRLLSWETLHWKRNVTATANYNMGLKSLITEWQWIKDYWSNGKGWWGFWEETEEQSWGDTRKHSWLMGQKWAPRCFLIQWFFLCFLYRNSAEIYAQIAETMDAYAKFFKSEGKKWEKILQTIKLG